MLSLELHLALLGEKGFEKLELWRAQRFNTRALPDLFHTPVERKTVKITQLSAHYEPRCPAFVLRREIPGNKWKKIGETVD